jgi:DNA-binding beta-propeller fold protein YncE
MKPLFPSLLSVSLGLGFLFPAGLAAERVVLVAGGGSETNVSALLKPTAAKLRSPFGVDFDRAGNLYLVEMTGHYVRKLDKSGMLTVIAGTGEKGGGGDDGPALKAQFNGIHNLAVTPIGDIYLADTWNNRVRKFHVATGKVTTIAGSGTKGFSGDGGLATEAQFGGIYCASLDPKGERLYLADLDNLRIRAVDLKTGLVRTVAGNGKKGVPMDSAKAVEAPLVDPRAVIADAKGRVYVLERGGHALRVVETDGTIRTVVGTGQKGNTGDDGDARQATLNGPKHLCFDLDGNILIADTENHVVRKFLLREGKIVRIAGSGRKGRGGLGGPTLEAELNQPHGVYVHADGTLYISDSSNHRVLKVVK